MTKDKKIAILKTAIVIINMGTYQNEQADPESTVFGSCNGCGAIEYMQHESDCEIVASMMNLELLMNIIKEDD